MSVTQFEEGVMDVVVWMIILGLSGQIPSRSQSQVGLTSQVRSHCSACRLIQFEEESKLWWWR